MRLPRPELLRRLLLVVVALHLGLAAARFVKVGWLRRLEALRAYSADGPVASAFAADEAGTVDLIERLRSELPERAWVLYEGVEGPVLERVNALLYPRKLLRRASWVRWREARAGGALPLAHVTRGGTSGLLLLRFDATGLREEVLP
ncbi:MAG: hypothetical protein R3F30_00625 [Planctomycetota bacterium]